MHRFKIVSRVSHVTIRNRHQEAHEVHYVYLYDYIEEEIPSIKYDFLGPRWKRTTYKYYRYVQKQTSMISDFLAYHTLQQVTWLGNWRFTKAFHRGIFFRESHGSRSRPEIHNNLKEQNQNCRENVWWTLVCARH